MQIVSRRQFACNVKSCFLGKSKKNILKRHLLKILPSILDIKVRIYVLNTQVKSDVIQKGCL